MAPWPGARRMVNWGGDGRVGQCRPVLLRREFPINIYLKTDVQPSTLTVTRSNWETSVHSNAERKVLGNCANARFWLSLSPPFDFLAEVLSPKIVDKYDVLHLIYQLRNIFGQLRNSDPAIAQFCTLHRLAFGIASYRHALRI
jgi:hypothetical protein